MSKKWDRLTKMLLAANPQHLVNWLLPGAIYKGELVREQIEPRAIEADILCIVVLNGRKMVLHVEIQRRSASNMGKRLWEYNAMTIFSTGLPVLSVVIYLYKGPKDCKVVDSPHIIVLPTGKEIHRFYFVSIKLWELPREVFKRQHLEGLLPLLPLTSGGASREVVEEMITGLQVSNNEDLLSLGYAFAALTFKQDADKEWLKRRFKMLEEILEESWAYREMVKEASLKALMLGREEGEKEGLEKGEKRAIEKAKKLARQEAQKEKKNELLQDERALLISYIETRFPEHLALARECAEVIVRPSVLNRIIVKLFSLQETAEVNAYLQSFLQYHRS
jgi:predicted transposase YdaD